MLVRSHENAQISPVEPTLGRVAPSPNASFWLGRTVVVTGATGFLGWHLIQQLRRLGARIRTLALHPSLRHPLLDLVDIEPVFGDVTDRQMVRSVLAGSEVIFHAAGPVAVWGVRPGEMWRGHVVGTANILHEAPPHARIVYTSSVTTIGASKLPIPLDEESPYFPGGLRLAYIDAKRTAEQLCLHAAVEGRWVTVVNPGYLIGPEDFGPSIVGRFCQRFWKGRIWLVPRGGINLVDVRDVASGHLLAAEHGQPGRRYILGGWNLTFRELCQGLAQVAHYRPRFLASCPTLLLQVAAAVAQTRAWWTGREPYPSFGQVQIGAYYWYYTSRRAYQELGYSVRPWEETLHQTWLWFQRQHRPKLRAIPRWWMRPAA